MENLGTLLGVVGGFISILLLIIGWFLSRLIDQQDDAHQSTAAQFKALLDKFDVLNSTMHEHKTDVGVIKAQVADHATRLHEMNNVYDRLRTVESEIAVIKTTRVK